MNLLRPMNFFVPALLMSKVATGAVFYNEQGVFSLLSEDTGREFSLVCSSKEKVIYLATPLLDSSYNMRFRFASKPFVQFYSYGQTQGQFWVSDAYDYRWQKEVLDNIAADRSMTVYTLFQGEQMLEYNIDLSGSAKLLSQFKRDCGIAY